MSYSDYSRKLEEKDYEVLKCIKRKKQMTYWEADECMSKKGFTCHSLLTRLTDLTRQGYLTRAEIKLKDGGIDAVWKATEKLEKMVLN